MCFAVVYKRYLLLSIINAQNTFFSDLRPYTSHISIQLQKVDVLKAKEGTIQKFLWNQRTIKENNNTDLAIKLKELVVIKFHFMKKKTNKKWPNGMY